MKKMEQKKVQKQAAIVQAARDIFLSEGYVGTSMDGIARAAGVTKQTVYRYFESKEVLFKASLEVQRKKDHGDFLDELDAEDTHQALLNFSLGFLQVHMTEEHLATIRLLVAEGVTAPEMTRAHFALGPRMTDARLCDFVSDRFGADDPTYAVKMLLSTLLSLRMNVLVGLIPPPTEAELKEHATKTVTLFEQLFK